MGAQDNTEKVLRSLHVLLSKSEPYPKEPSKVIVDKQQVLDLLSDLNTCIYAIMDEYELTKRSRDKAEREFRKQGDQIIWDASRKAEDIYAASVMYMDEALNRMRDIVTEAQTDVAKIYGDVDEQMKKEQQYIRENQSELKSQLQDLVDTEKYLHLIEERNKEIEKEKNEGKPEFKQEKSIYANRQTEIKVNQDYLDKLGMSVVDETEKEVVNKAGANATTYWWKTWTTERVGNRDRRVLTTIYGIRFHNDPGRIVYPYMYVGTMLMDKLHPGLKAFYKKWFKGAEGKIRKKEAEENDAWILDMYDAYLASRPNE